MQGFQGEESRAGSGGEGNEEEGRGEAAGEIEG